MGTNQLQLLLAKYGEKINNITAYEGQNQ